MKERTPRVDWAELLKRTLDFDVFACVRCGAGIRVLANVKAGRGVRAILEHLGLPTAGVSLAPAQGSTQAKDLPQVLYTPVFWALRDEPLPRSWWTLSLAPQPVTFTRAGPSSLELEVAQGHFLSMGAEQAGRGPAHRLEVGSQVKLEGMRVTVLAARR